MSQIAIQLKKLAMGLGGQKQRVAEIARVMLPRARQRLAEIQQHRDAILSAIEGDPPDSPIHDVALQVEKDLAVAMAKVSSLELEMDVTEAAMKRAHAYIPVTHDGTYACPQCWIREHLTTTVDALPMTSPVETYACPVCRYAFTVDYEFHPQAVLPKLQNPPL